MMIARRALDHPLHGDESGQKERPSANRAEACRATHLEHCGHNGWRVEDEAEKGEDNEDGHGLLRKGKGKGIGHISECFKDGDLIVAHATILASGSGSQW